MSLCPHGFTLFYDCPLCECPGCGRPQDLCVCHLDPRPDYHGAAGPLPKIEPREDGDDFDAARGMIVGTALSIPFWIIAIFAWLRWGA